MRRRTTAATAGAIGIALALGSAPLTSGAATDAVPAAPSVTAAPSAPVTIDYAVDAGEAAHVGGGNLHPFDERSPAQWLTDGININAVRGMDYSKRTNSYYENLPGWFEEPTQDRLMQINPDATQMIGTYYGFKGKVAAGDYGGNTDWQGLARQDAGAPYKEYMEWELAEAERLGIDVYSWVLWNEPDLQWGNQAAYFEAHKYAHQNLKAIDPGARSQAPELSGFKWDYITQFLTYCKANDCIPDVLAWHELSRNPLDIEEHAARLTQWLEDNDIPVMPFAITEYQGSGYSTTESGRRAQGNYNPGLAVSYLGGLERASEISTLEFGLRSEWGLPGGDPNARGFLGEMATFDDDGMMATGLWYVYNAYWDMTGRKVGTTIDKTEIDAVATYDADPEANRSGILVGNWEEAAKSVPVTLENLPEQLLVDGRVHLRAELIGETLATPSYGTVPVLTRDVVVTDGAASFSLELPGRTAARIFLTPATGDPAVYSAVEGTEAQDVEVTTTGAVAAQAASLGDTAFVSYTGGRPSSYVDESGAEIATETGDVVTYGVEVEQAGVYDLTSSFVQSDSGAFVQLYVDGESTGTPADLYAGDQRELEHNHGTVHLSEGTHELSYRIVGAGRNAAGTGYDIGIENVKLAAPGVASDAVRVSFGDDGADGSADSDYYVRSGDRIGELPVVPARDGYVFAGWNTAADGSGETVTADSVVEQDTTLWAIWLELGDVVYFVDAGDIDPATLSPGAKPGTHNSVTDQFFGPDPETGKEWGVEDVYAPSSAYPDLLTGEYTWPAENNGYTDESPASQTYRYAKDQAQPLEQRVGVPYKFQLDDGEYRVRLTIATGWASQVDRGYQATVTFNEGTENEVQALEPTLFSRDHENPITVDAIATVENGFLTVNVDMADTATGTVMVNEIEIWELIGDETGAEPAVAAAVDTRCVGKRVALVVSATNTSEARLSVDVSTPYGDTSIRNLSVGQTRSRVVATRSAAIGADEVEVSWAGDGGEPGSARVPYDAVSCG
ncbi:hypothetical protein GCM10027059_30830 [Myceligenerans halotolerans]